MTTAFEIYELGSMALKNRLVMAPMTRSRATAPDGTATAMMAEYYAQRAGAGLIISEGIQPSAVGQGYTNTPGLHSAEQVESWKPVTTAVHENGGVIYAQLMHTGRVGHPSLLPEGMHPVGPSPVTAAGQVYTYEGMQAFVEPRELPDTGIAQTISDFADAARNAIDAGFDGVEIHGANGYLIHQFLAPNSNIRTDDWGGSVEGRIRFGVEVASAVAAAIGAERVGFRISPGATFNDIQDDADLAATYTALVGKLAPLGLAYLHIMESADRELTNTLRAAWPGTLVLNPNTAPDPTGPDALALVEDGTTDLVSFGALFLANPDLPARLAAGGPFNTPDRSSFYGGDATGYLDYPSLEDLAVLTGAKEDA
ncbi:alkene reductase [Arthrobacter sp. MW3 TE3886]|uniref:alkene reductase n=1 Tax=Arthrobacter sp. MW3 TE3886 TaxID=3156254 RepID=UPI0035184137